MYDHIQKLENIYMQKGQTANQSIGKPALLTFSLISGFSVGIAIAGQIWVIIAN